MSAHRRPYQRACPASSSARSDAAIATSRTVPALSRISVISAALATSTATASASRRPRALFGARKAFTVSAIPHLEHSIRRRSARLAVRLPPPRQDHSAAARIASMSVAIPTAAAASAAAASAPTRRARSGSCEKQRAADHHTQSGIARRAAHPADQQDEARQQRLGADREGCDVDPGPAHRVDRFGRRGTRAANDVPARAAEEFAQHQQAEGVLFPRRRHQHHGFRIEARGGHCLEARGQQAQHLLEAAGGDGDLHEVGPVGQPEIAETARRTGQDVEIERLGRRAARLKLLDECGGAGRVLVEHKAHQLGRLLHQPRRCGGAGRGGTARKHEARQHLGLDDAVQQGDPPIGLRAISVSRASGSRRTRPRAGKAAVRDVLVSSVRCCISTT